MVNLTIEEVKNHPLFKQLNLEACLPIQERGDNTPEKTKIVKQKAVEILQLGGFSKKEAVDALLGVPFEGDERIPNFSTMYDWYIIQYSLMVYESIKQNDKYWELGFKYLQFSKQFSKEKFIEKFNLTFITDFRVHYSGVRGSETSTTTLKVYSNFEGDFFQLDDNGYVGFVLTDYKKVLKFAKIFLNKKSIFLKDVDMFINRLGGLTQKEVKMLKQNTFEYYRN